MDPLYGYEEVEKSLEQFITRPGHIFIIGQPGAGKTTLVNNFLKRYFKHHYGDTNKITTDVFFMNSHQDRGIHTVRNVLLDYVRQPTCKPKTVRWIVIDHLESFPELSQQALRRPMEIYSHVACFIFIGNSRNHIIAPLLSRCKNVELPLVPLETISHRIMERYGSKGLLSDETLTWLVSHSAGSIREFCQYVKLLTDYFKDHRPTDIHDIVLEMCSIPSFDIYMPLIQAILKQDTINVMKNLTKLWIVGESFEDVFETVKKMTDMFGYSVFKEGQLIYDFLMKGWIQYSQGYTTYRSLLITAN